MVAISTLLIACIAIGAMGFALRRPGGPLRYPFLCGAVYLAWVFPQLSAISVESRLPEGGVLWLSIMVLVCLLASLFGWRLGLQRDSARGPPPASPLHVDKGRLFLIVVGLTVFVYMLHVMIGLRPVEERDSSTWSGPLTIIVFFLSLDVMSLYLSLVLALKERTPRALVLAGANVLLCGTSAFVALRRGEMIDFGVACAAAYWFALGKRIPTPAIVSAICLVTVVTYAIEPLRVTAKSIEARTGTAPGLLSPEVWQQVDFVGAIDRSSKEAHDLVNAVFLIEYSNKWGHHTYGRQSWDRIVFQWVPAQILGADFKKSLMFGSEADYGQIEAEFGHLRVGGTTPTGFGFSYQEFGIFGFVYFVLIGFLMGSVWRRAQRGDLWMQAMYASFVAGALLSVTHNAMWLLVQVPLFYSAILILRSVSRKGASRYGSMRVAPRGGR